MTTRDPYTTVARIERTFTVGDRTFHLVATANSVHYGAHVREEGTDVLPFNSELRPLRGGDPWAAALDIANVAKAQVETDLETCEHGLSKWLCAGPQHYPLTGAEREAWL